MIEIDINKSKLLRDKDKVLKKWSNTKIISHEGFFLLELEKWAKLTPTAVAVEYGDKQYTYYMLNNSVNNLALYLLEKGLKKNQVAIVVLPKTDLSLVLILALMKICVTYTLFSYGQSTEYLNFIIEEIQPDFLITDKKDIAIQIDFIEISHQNIYEELVSDFQATISLDSIAYINYTSGSEGRPKGVAVTYNNLNNFMYGIKSNLKLNSNIRLLSITHLTFDIVYFELFFPLMVGGTVVIGTEDIITDLVRLEEVIQKSKITLVQATPSFWGAFFYSDLRLPKDLFILCGGEVLSQKLANKILQTNNILWNLYGPTETTVWSVIARLTKEKKEVILGRPIDNTFIYILNDNLDPVDIGEYGEIYIGGKGVSEGYYKNKQLTEKNFFPNPFVTEGAERMYKTGDIGCFDPDGNLIYIGRLDRQVKIRGIRINLDSIEKTINQFPPIKKSVVVVNEDKILKAYVEVNEAEDDCLNKLKTFLKKRLSKQETPHNISVVKRIPLNKNGKVDYRALSQKSGGKNKNIRHTKIAIEKKLQKIWKKVLLSKKISIEADFYQLGGTSISAMMMVAMISKSLNYRFTITDIFRYPTISKMAEVINKGLSQKIVEVEHRKFNRINNVPISFLEHAIWVSQELKPTTTANNIGIIIKFSMDLNFLALKQAIIFILNKYPALRCKYYKEGKEIFKRVQPINENDLSFEERKSHNPSVEIEEFFEQKMSLEKPPIIKFKLLKTEDNTYLFLILCHHIYVDDWTIKVLLENLSKGYERFYLKQKQLDHIGQYFFDFNNFYSEVYNIEIRNETIAYWRSALAEIEFSSVKNPFSQRKEDFEENCLAIEKETFFDHEMFLLTNSLVRSSKKTMFIIIFSLIRSFFYKCTETRDFPIGIPVSLRHEQMSFDMIGLFVNVLPVNITLEQDMSILDVCSKIEMIMEEVFKYRYISRDDLLSILNMRHPEESIFPVTFNLTKNNYEKAQFYGTLSNVTRYSTKKSHFPLSIFAEISENTIAIKFKCFSKIFDEKLLNYLIFNFKHFSKLALQFPGKNIAAIDFWDKEQVALLKKWGKIGFKSNSEMTIISSFKQMVTLMPHAPAVQHDKNVITYIDMDKDTDKLAIVLNRIHFKEKKLIGVAIPKSIELIKCYLAILKAGGTYVYIDKSCPKERVAALVKELNICFILTDRISDTKEAGWDCNCIEYSELQKETVFCSLEEYSKIENKISKEDLVCIISTSGSTGIPKLVKVSHENILTLLSDDIFLEIELGKNVALASDLSFDATIFEIWGALSKGACLVMMPKAALTEPNSIDNFIKQKEIDFLFVTTGLFHELIRLKPDVFRNLNTLFFGGETINERLVQKTFANGVNVPKQLIHCYGPTEAICFTTACDLTKQENLFSSISIGFPLKGRSVFILNDNLKLVPIGSVGEICISGPGISQGYINHELNKEKFITIYLPEVSATHIKIYRTGDYGRFLGDGSILFLGRKDQQFKKNGYRIEPKEIELVLTKVNIVETAIVLPKMVDGLTFLNVYVLLNKNNKHITKEEAVTALFDYSRKNLPFFMLPDRFFIIDKIPFTIQGKIDVVKLLQENVAIRTTLYKHNIDFISEIVSIVEELLQVEKVALDDNFFDIGLNSLTALRFCSKLNNQLKTNLKISDIFRYHTINLLSIYLSTAKEEKHAVNKLINYPNDIRSDSVRSNDIAIIGIAGKFPGAKNIEEFWDVIISGRSTINKFDTNILKTFGVSKKFVTSREYRPYSGYLDDLYKFAAEFFGFNAKAASIMDPHHRILMELVWEAFERAGYSVSQYTGKIGIFCGMSESAYWSKEQLKKYHVHSAKYNEIFYLTNEAFLASHIAYKFNLKGSAVNIHAACSTSLIAVIEACNSIIAGVNDIAVAGGISLLMPSEVGYMYEQGHIFSEKGTCRPFSEEADGIVPGSGGGVVICKSLQKAIEDGDNILAVIRGYGMNNDANEKVSFAAPSISGQEKCLLEAQRKAGIVAEKMRYIEGHGTATRLGDVVEFQALKNAFLKNGSISKRHCALGSVKFNIGHTNYASGIAGLIKLVLMLRHKKIPPMPYFNAPNKDMENFLESPFYINNKLESFYSREKEIYVGASSFGVGGTNTHIILSNYHSLSKKNKVSEKNFLLMLSAKTNEELTLYKEILLQHIITLKASSINFDENEFFYNMIKTLMFGREQFKFKFYVVCKNLNEVLIALDKNFNLKNADTDIDVDAFMSDADNYNKIELPTYPFRRKIYNRGSMREIYKSRSLKRHKKNTIEDILISQWQKILGNYNDVKREDDFFSLGGDSLAAIDLLAFINKEFSLSLKIGDLINYRTVYDQVDLIRSSVKKQLDSELLVLHFAPKKPAIIFVHPIGGTLFSMMPVINQLMKDNMIYGLQDSLMCGRYIKYNSVNEIAECYIQLLLEKEPQGPYTFVGYSFGGTIAFEMSRQLMRRGEKIEKLVMFDTWASLPKDLSTIESFKETIKRQLFNLKLDLFPEFSAQENLWYEILWTRMQNLVDYRPEKLDINMLLFKAREINDEYSQLEKFNGIFSDTNGWFNFVNTVETIFVPGGHEEVFSNKNNQVLAEKLQERLIL